MAKHSQQSRAGLITFQQAVEYIPGDITCAAVHSWRVNGLRINDKRVRLWATKIGNVYHTTHCAIDQFLAVTNRAPRTPKDKSVAPLEEESPRIAEPRNVECELITADVVAKILGCSDSKVWEFRKAKRIPAPIILSSNMTRWRYREIIAWVEAGCPNASNWQWPPPKPFGYGLDAFSKHFKPRRNTNGEA